MTNKASVVIVESKDTDFLFLRRGVTAPKQGWCLAGGMNEDGETELQTAVREMFEETGITANEADLEFCGTAESSTGLEVSVFWFRLQEDVVVTLSDEHDDFRWTCSTKEMPLAGNTQAFMNVGVLHEIAKIKESRRKSEKDKG